MPGDDSQGFDWQGLLKAATPYAAALIPAAIGGLAGGRLGGGALGAASGFTSGMAGEQRAQDQYQQEAAKTVEANARMQQEQQKMQMEQQNAASRQKYYESQQAHAAAQIPYLEAQTRELNQKADEWKTTNQGQQDFADQLDGAKRAAFLSLPPSKREDYIKDWQLEQRQRIAMPGLVQGAIIAGMPQATAQAYAQTPKGFDALSKYINDIGVARERAKDRPGREGSFSRAGFYDGPDGKVYQAIVDNHTGAQTFSELPSGLTPQGGKKPSAQQVQTTYTKEFWKAHGIANGAQAARVLQAQPGLQDDWNMSPMGQLALDYSAGNLPAQQYYQKQKELIASDPAAIDKITRQRGLNEYMSQPEGSAGPSGQKAELAPSEAGFQQYIQTEPGKKWLASHRDRVVSDFNLSAKTAPAAAPAPAPTAKPTAKPAARGAAEAATPPTAAAPTPPAVPRPRAVNPKTGKAVEFDGTNWVPAK